MTAIPRAGWVSYVAFWYVFATARGFAGEISDYPAFDPSILALVSFFFFFLSFYFFLYSSRFPFSVPSGSIPLANLRKVIALATADPAIRWSVL